MSRTFHDIDYPLQELTEKIIGAAVAVHKELGPGFVERIYENALVLELKSRGHSVEKQVVCDVRYADTLIGQHRLDILIDGEIIVELKAVEKILKIHAAQLRSTLKAAKKQIGLVINFNQETLVRGLKRVVN
ncbi:MAG: GxxExxY protein [bacterium]|nr:GxxExxY protein [bacterium]